MPTIDDDNPENTESLAEELAKVELNNPHNNHHHPHQPKEQLEKHQQTHEQSFHINYNEAKLINDHGGEEVLELENNKLELNNDTTFELAKNGADEKQQEPNKQDEEEQQPIEGDEVKVIVNSESEVNTTDNNVVVDDDVVDNAATAAAAAVDQNQKLARSFVVDVEVDKVEKLVNGETDEQMIKRKETVMLMSLKRRAELEAKRAMKENELARTREQAAMKKEMQEHRKLEYKQRREAILEQYRLKKKAAEAAERGDGLPMGEKSSTGGSATNLSTSGSSASSSNHLRGPRSMKSSQSHHTSVWTLYNGPKLFAKPTTKTNLILIQNAILKALEGAANAKTLKKMQDTITAHSKTCGHFLILFRSRGQFRGLYEYDDKQNSITKLDGIGPKIIHNEDILKYYKFDSPKRQFTEVQTRHISLTIIAFTIQDHLWSKSLSSRVSSHDLVHHQQQHINQHPQQRNGH